MDPLDPAMVLLDKADRTLEDPQLVITDLFLMDLTCLPPAAQAQEWAPLQCHLLGFHPEVTHPPPEPPHPVGTLALAPHQTAYPLLPPPHQSVIVAALPVTQ